MAALMWDGEKDEATSCFSEIAICVIILSNDQCLFDYKASETVCNKDDWYFVILLLSNYQLVFFGGAYIGAYISVLWLSNTGETIE